MLCPENRVDSSCICRLAYGMVGLVVSSFRKSRNIAASSLTDQQQNPCTYRQHSRQFSQVLANLGSQLIAYNGRFVSHSSFFVVCHGGSDGDTGRILLTIGFQASCAEIDFCLHLNGNDLLTGVCHKIHLAAATVIGVVVQVQILNGLQLLADILLR